MKYVVTTRTILITNYEVEADSEEQAGELYGDIGVILNENYKDEQIRRIELANK